MMLVLASSVKFSPERKRENEAIELIHRGRKEGKKSSAIALSAYFIDIIMAFKSEYHQKQ